MLKYIISCCVLLLLVFVFWITKKTNNQAKILIGTHMIIPESMSAQVQCRDTTVTIDDTKIKLVVYYNFKGCSSCKLKDLMFWKNYVKTLDRVAKNRLQPIFIMNTGGLEDRTRVDLYSYKFNYPVFFDRKADFERHNALPDNELFHVFLLDKENRVVLIGTPMSNPSLWEEYLSKASQLTQTEEAPAL